MLAHLVTYLLSFTSIWIGSGLAIHSVERLSRSLRLPSFAISFLVLGLFTSMSEASVGINAIMQNDPEIYVGNLIGASIVLFMLIIPLLAITGNSIRVSPELHGFNLPASLAVIGLPVILAMDGRIGRTDSLTAIVLFIALALNIETRKGLLEKVKNLSTDKSLKYGREIARAAFGLLIIFIAGRFLVDQTIYFSNLLEISPFIVSLLVIALGTNIPELSLVVRSVFMRNRQVAFGDFVGSAAFNTFLVGALTIINRKPVQLTNSYVSSLFFLIVGLMAFYHFARTKNTITRLEGLALLSLYILFLLVEIFLHQRQLSSAF